MQVHPLLAMRGIMFARWAVGDGHGRELHRSNEVSLFRWFDSGYATFVDNQTVTCRRRRQELRRGTYGESGIQWHGSHVGQPDFSENSRLVAYSIGDSQQTCSDHEFSTCSQLRCGLGQRGNMWENAEPPLYVTVPSIAC